MAQSKYSYVDFSGSVQQKTSTHIKKPNEVIGGHNTDFWTKLGALRRRPGAQSSVAELPKLPIDAPPLGSFIARFPDSIEIWAAQNDAATSPTEAILQYWTGPNDDDWTNIQTGITAGSEVNMIDDLDEVLVATYDPLLDVIGDSFSVDSTHDVSTTRQLDFGPDARFFIEFAGTIYAADCLVNGTRYRDRLYKSSGPTGAVTFIRSAQTDPPGDFTLVNQVPVMTSATAPVGTVAGSSFTTGFDPYKAFDKQINRISGSLANAWATTGATTGTVSYDFVTGKVITHYSIVGVPTNPSANDATAGPKTWTFQGSNDNSSWTTIDTQTNVANWATGEKRTYATANTTSYRYYRINVTANQGYASYMIIAEIEFLNSTANADLLEVEIDSARYIKPGLQIDIYEAGTDTLRYTITPTAVDKINDTFSFLPETQSFSTSNVNTTTDVITLPDATSFTTGTPIIFGSSGTVPTGLTAGTTYYAINVSSTTIKVATSALNASLGIAIDITATGSGNHRVRLSYVFGNKDEIWKHGRKGKLTRFWNVDYRNPEASDWLKIPSTYDGQDAIKAVGKTVNRMFIWTDNSMIRFDGQNIVPLRNDVGCASQKTLCYYDSFMVWLDNKGRIWVRNDEASQQDVISEAIQDIMKLVPQSQLSEATAVCVDDTYKLYLGQVDGRTLRVCYNFRTNQWADEWWTPQMPAQIEYTYDGDVKPHFIDEKGQMWVDEQGTDDNGQAIDWNPEIGNDTFNVDEIKSWKGVKVYSKNCAGAKIYASVDDGQWVEIGQISKAVEAIAIQNLPKGTMINFKVGSSILGDTPQIDKITVWYNREEDTFRVSQ